MGQNVCTSLSKGRKQTPFLIFEAVNVTDEVNASCPGHEGSRGTKSYNAW